jgi:integrase
VKAEWREIDLDEAVWTVPASRMKARKEHKVPLAPEAIQLLESLPREEGNPFVFIGAHAGESITDSAIRMTLRRMGHNGDSAVLHGFRSSFSTWANEKTRFDTPTIELSLAHSVGNAVEKAYRRTDLLAKRKELMGAWAKFVTAPPAAQADEPDHRKVIPIGAHR